VGEASRRKDLDRQADRQAKEHELQRERIRLKRHQALIDAGQSIARTFIRWAAVVLVFWIGGRCIDSIAGKDTKFSAVVELMTKVQADRWIAYIVAGVATGAWALERRTRQRTIKENAEYVRELEKKIDPRRSSSGLTATGKPRKEDVA